MFKKLILFLVLVLLSAPAFAQSGYKYSFQNDYICTTAVPSTNPDIFARYMVLTAGAGISITNSAGGHTSTIACTGGSGTPDGTALLPSMAFTNDPDTGIYSKSANDLGVSTGGTLRHDISTTAETMTLPQLGPVGSAAAPAFTFSADPDTGVYHEGTNDVGLSAGGVKQLDCTTSTCTFANGATGNLTGNVTGNVTGGHSGILSSAHNTTIASDGAGTSPSATLTTPSANLETITCNDTDGCTLVLGETSVASGQMLVITSLTANAVTINDSTGVSETAGALVLGQYDSATFVYSADRWIELSLSNN